MAESFMGRADGAGIDLLMDVPLQVSVELGRRRMLVAEVLKLGPGSVVELAKASGEPLDIYVNDRLVARGEAVMIGERYGVRITEIEPAGDRVRGISGEEGLR
ncbi:MAG: flagellar motor switch protein FliN [Deltaproteobacteria bacterium]|nr:flagellar motor switch protein FliN [Deltaproteobacteria bacterium]